MTDETRQVQPARFEELRFYQLAQSLPSHEKHNLASQLRPAALSTVLNIAEGYGRYHFPDRLRFFYYARGSLFETLSGFVAAHTVGYIDDDQLAWARQIVAETGSTLNAYINYIRKQRQGAQTFGEKSIRETTANYETDDPIPVFPNSLIPTQDED